MKLYFWQRIHVSWLVTSWCIGVVIGVILIPLVHSGMFSGFGWLVVSLMILAISFKARRRYMVIAMLVSGCLMGAWRGDGVLMVFGGYHEMIGKHVQIRGKVMEDPDLNSRGEMGIRLGRITDGQRQLDGSIWLSLKNNPSIRRSDLLTVDGVLAPGFANFPVTLKKAEVKRIQRETAGDVALDVRSRFSEQLEKYIDSPAVELGEGFLLGQKRGLPNDLAESLKIAGLTHIVVASGYNLTILVRLSRKLFAKISKFMAFFVSLMMTGGFVMVTGLSPSMTRAGLVTGLALLAWYYGRNFHPVTLISLVGATTLLVNPSYGWGDLGWSLSFSAFAGVMILAPLLKDYFFGSETPNFFVQILIETVSAQIVTIPIILLTFGKLSLVAPLANLLIVPFVPLAMLLTFAGGVLSFVVPFIAKVLVWPAQVLLDMMISVIHWCASLEWAQMDLSISTTGFIMCYIAILLIIWYLSRVTRLKLSRQSIIE